MFERGMYLSVFYCLYFVNKRPTYMLDEQVVDERGPQLEMEEDIRILDNRQEHWEEVFEDNNENRSKVHALRWEVSMKYKEEELTKRYFSVTVLHPKGWDIIWTCEKDNIIKEKQEYRAIGLWGFDYTLFE